MERNRLTTAQLQLESHVPQTRMLQQAGSPSDTVLRVLVSKEATK